MRVRIGHYDEDPGVQAGIFTYELHPVGGAPWIGFALRKPATYAFQ